MPPTKAAAVLGTMANPHPRLWDKAVASFRRAVAAGHTTGDLWHWFGFWDAMLAATGYEPERLLAELMARLELARPAPVTETILELALQGQSALEEDADADVYPILEAIVGLVL